MKRSGFPILLLLAAWIWGSSAAAASVGPARGLIIASASDAAPAIHQAALRIYDACGNSPLLIALSDGHPPHSLSDSRALAAGKREVLAYHHVVVIGMADDPLVKQASQHEALIKDRQIYAFGFGVLDGDIGWCESGPNPWLHSPAVGRTPYEAETVVITGTTPAGIALAADAFLASGFVNGAVAAPGWTRPDTTILDHDPMIPSKAPPHLPAKVGPWTRIALTYCGADVSRGILADAGVAPDACWLVKYHRPGVWDGAGAKLAFQHFSAGLHRRACGDAVLLAHFSSPSEAATAVVKAAAAARLTRDGRGWHGSLKGYQDDRSPAGPLACWSIGPWMVMSSLPPEISKAMRVDAP